MSRDQRPRRTVMVDSAPDVADPAPAPGADTGKLALAPPVVPDQRILIPALLFLLACVLGAIGIALLPAGSVS